MRDCASTTTTVVNRHNLLAPNPRNRHWDPRRFCVAEQRWAIESQISLDCVSSVLCTKSWWQLPAIALTGTHGPACPLKPIRLASGQLDWRQARLNFLYRTIFAPGEPAGQCKRTGSCPNDLSVTATILAHQGKEDSDRTGVQGCVLSESSLPWCARNVPYHTGGGGQHLAYGLRL